MCNPKSQTKKITCFRQTFLDALLSYTIKSQKQPIATPYFEQHTSLLNYPEYEIDRREMCIARKRKRNNYSEESQLINAM